MLEKWRKRLHSLTQHLYCQSYIMTMANVMSIKRTSYDVTEIGPQSSKQPEHVASLRVDCLRH